MASFNSSGVTEGGTVVTEFQCPECQSRRTDASVVCPTCGAPPIREGEQRALEEEVRSQDLEPYITLRYIARLFKVLAALMGVLLIGEIVLGFTAGGASSLPELIGEITRIIVLAGLMWGGGDITLLLIDAGHDLRVARILLGRINHEMHRAAYERSGKLPTESSERRADPTRV